MKLKKALEDIKNLEALVPICSHCNKIRDDNGCWNHLGTYLDEYSQTMFSHGICPDCMLKYYPDYTD